MCYTSLFNEILRKREFRNCLLVFPKLQNQIFKVLNFFKLTQSKLLPIILTCVDPDILVPDPTEIDLPEAFCFTGL